MTSCAATAFLVCPVQISRSTATSRSLKPAGHSVRAVPVDDPPGERRVVLLAERDGERILPIWVGGFEGDSIAIGLVHAQARRPLTFAFAGQLLEAAGARLREVRI